MWLSDIVNQILQDHSKTFGSWLHNIVKAVIKTIHCPKPEVLSIFSQLGRKCGPPLPSL